MKKTLLFMMAFAVCTALSSCGGSGNEPEEPEVPGQGTETPEEPQMSEAWKAFNAEVQTYFSTTEIIPEPEVEYEISLTNIAAGGGQWPSGIYSIGFRGHVLDTYGQTLQKAGWTFNEVNSQSGYDAWVSPQDYIIFIDQAGYNLMQVQKKSDVMPN